MADHDINSEGARGLKKHLEEIMPMRGVPDAAQRLIWLQSWEFIDDGRDAVIMAYEDRRTVALLAAGILKD